MSVKILNLKFHETPYDRLHAASWRRTNTWTKGHDYSGSLSSSSLPTRLKRSDWNGGLMKCKFIWKHVTTARSSNMRIDERQTSCCFLSQAKCLKPSKWQHWGLSRHKTRDCAAECRSLKPVAMGTTQVEQPQHDTRLLWCLSITLPQQDG
jgi:hypothetical protein